MDGPFGVRVSGPLEVFAVGFGEDLAASGYAPKSGEAQLRLMGHLSIWLGSQGLTAADLDARVLARFAVTRRLLCRNLRYERAVLPLLDFLRRRGVAPLPVPVAGSDPVVVLTVRFGEYLAVQRGLSPATIRSYVSQVTPFLNWRAERVGCDWSGVTEREVARYLTDHVSGRPARSVLVTVNALRSLLRWMFADELIGTRLSHRVAKVQTVTLGAVPQALTPAQVAALFAALPTEGPVRSRNEAMLMLLWRLGLRGGEVAALSLEDIDWRRGILVVHGKGDRTEQLPLPVDVGRLLAAYLSGGRPAGARHRRVFLAIDAPHAPIGTAAVSSVVARAAAAAGIPGPVHAHQLRHTTACGVLAAGGGLVEAGQLLRHASTAATAIYAKTDIAGLAVIARPWPTADAS